MNQISTNVKYPFKLFNEESFTKEKVIKLISDRFILAEEYFSEEDGSESRFPVMNSGLIASKSIDIFQMAIMGRICVLNEDYTGAFFSPRDNQIIREFYKYANGNLETTLDIWEDYQYRSTGMNMFGMDREHDKLFKHDIALALNMEHMFYLESEIDYHSLHWFAGSSRNKGEKAIPPFSKEGIDLVFRNIPIVRVW